MKKNYKVVAYRTTRHEMVVLASSCEEARKIANGRECIDDRWNEDYEYFDFEIVDTMLEDDE